MAKYNVIRARQQKEFESWVDKFGFYAFSNEQFKQGMERLGLDADDTKKIYRGPAGLFYLKTCSPTLREMFDRFDAEMAQARKDGGSKFYFDMFVAELFDHEYNITLSVSDALDALGLDASDVARDQVMHAALQDAKKYVLEHSS